MKRSEMREKIFQYLMAEVHGYDGDPAVEINSKIDAEGLMVLIEQAGMVPPVTVLQPLGIKDNGWDPE